MLRHSGADIIGLQELAPEQGAAIEARLRDVYPYQVLHPTGIPRQGGHFRYPVHETALSSSTPGGLICKHSSRLPMESSTSWSPIRLRPASVGIAPGTLSSPASRSVASPRRHAGPPGVLLTDFNRVGWQAEYRQLRSAGLIDAFGAAGRGMGFTLPARILHLAYRGHPLGDIPLPPLLRVD